MSVSCLVGGCVPHRLYNAEPDQYLERVSDGRSGGVVADLAIVEFDDHGILWERDQLDAAVGAIRDANSAASDGTLVAVYIHGWKNNADRRRGSGDFARFRDRIKRDAAVNPADRLFACDRIVGVYLGWHGDTGGIPGQRQLTFWDRRQAADRVASIHMKETLLRIMEAAKEHPGSKLFIAGHSMGGMIIGKSISPILASLLLAGEDSAAMPVDLVLLQNPALEALASWQVIDLLKRYGVSLELRSADGSSERAEGPLIAAITSEADRATRVAFPLGRSLANLRTSYRGDHAAGEPSQRFLATRALGHVDYLVSHRAFVRDGEVVIERKPGAWNDTPFWVIRVSEEISKDHSDVNNPLFRELAAQLIAANKIFRTDIETWITKSAAGDVGGARDRAGR